MPQALYKQGLGDPNDIPTSRMSPSGVSAAAGISGPPVSVKSSYIGPAAPAVPDQIVARAVACVIPATAATAEHFPARMAALNVSVVTLAIGMMLWSMLSFIDDAMTFPAKYSVERAAKMTTLKTPPLRSSLSLPILPVSLLQSHFNAANVPRTEHVKLVGSYLAQAGFVVTLLLRTHADLARFMPFVLAVSRFNGHVHIRFVLADDERPLALEVKETCNRPDICVGEVSAPSDCRMVIETSKAAYVMSLDDPALTCAHLHRALHRQVVHFNNCSGRFNLRPDPNPTGSIDATLEQMAAEERQQQQ